MGTYMYQWRFIFGKVYLKLHENVLEISFKIVYGRI